MQAVKNPLTCRLGFTLFEITLVMAIILIVGALASPLIFQHMHSDAKVGAAADLMQARWNDCRTQAIEDGQPYVFSVIPNTGKFKIEPYAQANMGGSQPASGNASGPAKGLVIEDQLPAGIRFGTKDSPINPDSDEPIGGDYVPVAVFMPDGLAQDDVEITFGGKGATTITVRLNSQTGVATIVRPQAEEGR
jgi:prepilin-type N-terminal cleavage/methylation domain-containing protein